VTAPVFEVTVIRLELRRRGWRPPGRRDSRPR
jgi:hypothetical protein